jgi:hypothetical protein
MLYFPHAVESINKSIGFATRQRGAYDTSKDMELFFLAIKDEQSCKSDAEYTKGIL